MIRTKSIPVPGRTIGVTIPVSPAAPRAECAPKPTGLFWFSDATGDFTETSEAAYLGSTEPTGPVLAVARVLGETCGAVTWAATWTPDSGTGGDPATVERGADLYVYPASDGGPGQLSVSATCAGRTFGPILLTLLPAAGGGGDCCPDPVVGPVIEDIWQIDEATQIRVYLCTIAGTGLTDAMWVDYEAVFDGGEPDVWRLISPIQGGILQGVFWALPDIATQVTVSAMAYWQCGGVDMSRAIVWPSIDLSP